MTGKAKFQQQVPSAGLFLMSIILLLLPLYSAAQDSKHNQVWFDVSAKINLAKGLTLTPEFGYRTEPSIKLNQLYLRTYLSYRPNEFVKLSLWAAQFNASRPENLRAIEVRTSVIIVQEASNSSGRNSLASDLKTAWGLISGCFTNLDTNCRGMFIVVGLK